MHFLKSEYYDKTIVFLTPARLCYEGMTGAEPSTRPTKQADALPLQGYIEIMKKTAALYDIPVLDMYENLGIDPTNHEERDRYTFDGLHFNDAGHHMIAERLKAFLEAL